jgi:hypothetical protein
MYLIRSGSGALSRPGRYQVRWSHLFSFDEDPTELHALAQRIGLRRSWFQPAKTHAPGHPARPWRNHYDVTESKRAVPITLQEFCDLIDAYESGDAALADRAKAVGR